LNEWTEKKVLIIGKAYPEPSKKYIETVCTGGITEDGDLVRLYPVPFRYWAQEKRYKVFSLIRVRMQKDASDKRKESYRIDQDSLEIVGHVESWAERMSLIGPVIANSVEELERRYRTDWTSLGLVRIRYDGFEWKWGASDWSLRKRAYMDQFLLFTPRMDLQHIPIKLILRYKCADNPQCRGHSPRLIMWEYLETFRKWTQAGDAQSALDKMKSAIENRFSDQSKEPLALVGTHCRYPVWLLGGLFFPPKQARQSLFDKFR
jgi:hypothetical protein